MIIRTQIEESKRFFNLFKWFDMIRKNLERSEVSVFGKQKSELNEI